MQAYYSALLYSERVKEVGLTAVCILKPEGISTATALVGCLILEGLLVILRNLTIY